MDQKPEIKATTEWTDSLLWCPSQCTKIIEYKGKYFEIYLRWRHDDPWTADLIPQDGKGEFIKLNVEYWDEYQLGQLKNDAEEKAAIWLKENIK